MRASSLTERTDSYLLASSPVVTMSTYSPYAITPHESLSIVAPTTLVYTAIWSILFLLYQRILLPRIFLFLPSTSTWYSSLPANKQRHYNGRLLFSLHHSLVAYYAIAALTATTAPTALYSMRSAMYHEVACDLFDVAVIAFTESGFTGLHWQGLLLHHILSILAILITFTLHTPLATTAQLALLLDGTGATDYLFNTLLPHTPAIQYRPLLLLASLTTAVFFIVRLLWFPWLAWLIIRSGLADGGLWTGVVCAGVMGMTLFFNVGMIGTRWRQHSAMWRQQSRGSGKATLRQSDEREMEDRAAIVL